MRNTSICVILGLGIFVHRSPFSWAANASSYCTCPSSGASDCSEARKSCPAPGESDKLDQESGSLSGMLLRLPERILGVEREDLRARVRQRLQDRIARSRARMWVAAAGSCWYTDYSVAYRVAELQKKMLVVYFASERGDSVQQEFESITLADPALSIQLNQYVCARVRLKQRHIHKGAKAALVADPAFAHLKEAAGFAIVDLSGGHAELDGQVNFIRRFAKGRCSAAEMAVVLGLPRATLTQRTMIYAVRMHSDRPSSTAGELSPYLLGQAARHSEQMARIQLQGHHNWESRFHEISRRMGSGLSAREVVAESWGHEDLLDAAIECVHSWRQSPGHWNAVRAAHTYYGYDMKQGTNGKWYATGLFGD